MRRLAETRIIGLAVAIGSSRVHLDLYGSVPSGALTRQGETPHLATVSEGGAEWLFSTIEAL
jgi:hypothetical protein